MLVCPIKRLCAGNVCALSWVSGTSGEEADVECGDGRDMVKLSSSRISKKGKRRKRDMSNSYTDRYVLSFQYREWDKFAP